MNERAMEAHADSPLLKGAFGFRLGTTSYIIPSDILPNVRWLAPRIDDVELVLFESDAFSNMPSQSVVRELAGIASENALSYTVHLPLDAAFGHPDRAVRCASIDGCLRLADLMEPLSPLAYVVHFTGDRRGMVPANDMTRWLDGHREALSLLVDRVGSRRLCAETLEYPFELVLPVVEELDLSVCLDIGHLMLTGRDVAGYYERLCDRVRIIHAHGIIDGHDHKSLAACDEAVFSDLVNRLPPRSDVSTVLTMEIFSEADFHDSMRVMDCLRRSLATGREAR